jgi:hypothetical protein
MIFLKAMKKITTELIIKPMTWVHQKTFEKIQKSAWVQFKAHYLLDFIHNPKEFLKDIIPPLTNHSPKKTVINYSSLPNLARTK